MSSGSAQIVSRLYGQSKFQMFTCIIFRPLYNMANCRASIIQKPAIKYCSNVSSKKELVTLGAR